MPERPTREEVDDLIVRTREAHEVLKDIKAATREMKDTIREAHEAQVALIGAVVASSNDAIEIAVEEGLKRWTAAVDEAIVDATDAVYQRFDVIAGILLGEAGDMEDAARMVRGTMEKGHVVTSNEQWQMEQMQAALDRRLNDQIEVRKMSKEGDL